MMRFTRSAVPRIVAAVVAIAAHWGAAAPARAEEKTPEKVFVGYLYGAPRHVNYRLYTHLCHAFVTADADGFLNQGRGVPSRELTTEAHQAGVKVLLSLGGWGWDEKFAAMTMKPEAEDRYVQAVLKMVADYGYDGIDLDWEYPDTAKEVVGFERLSRRLRQGLDALGVKKGRPMFLTMAASSNRGTLRWLDRAFLVETMDWVNVMTYDFAGDWTDYAGHHSPLFASSKQPEGHSRSTAGILKYLLEERGLPASKLAVGLPLYGKGFAVNAPYASTKGAPKRRLPQGEYFHLHKLKEEHGWTRLWDDETKNPWLISPQQDVVIGYDDAESATLKAEWAKKLGFRGLFFWQVAGDRLPDGSNPVQEAARKAWGDGR